MRRRVFAGCFIALLNLQGGAAFAQQAVGDSLWRAGRRTEAVEAYMRLLASDSNAVRANFRIAQELVGRNPDSAMTFLRNARRRVPTDPDLLFAEATWLSWAKDYRGATLRFDTLLMFSPDLDYARIARARVLSWAGDLEEARKGYASVLQRNGADRDAYRDAEFGSAQVASWQGRLDEADSIYAGLLSSDPREVRSIVGLAAVRNWQGMPFAALALLDSALKLDPANVDGRRLLEDVSRARSPSLELSASWSRDTDGNHVAWQNATQGLLIRDGVRFWLTAGLQSATDPARNTTRMLGEVGATATGKRIVVAGAIGARELGVDVSPTGVLPDRTEITWRASVRGKLHPNVTLSAGASHAPFDEIAALLARGINLTNYDASAEWRPDGARGKTTLAASGGSLEFSDGNRRTGATVRASRRLGSLTLGGSGRIFSFARAGNGYFAPRQFVLTDVWGGLEKDAGKWSLGFSAGGGAQWIGANAATQGQWHADTRVQYRAGKGVALSVFGGFTTSAAASAVGAFRYEMMGASARVSF